VKRGIIIILVFTLLIGLCVLEEMYIKNNLNLLEQKSNELLVLINENENVNTEEIKLKVREIKKFWDKTEGYLCLVVNPVNMEEAGEQISKISTLSELNKKDELIVEVNLLIYFAVSYKHIIVPHIQNIL